MIRSFDKNKTYVIANMNFVVTDEIEFWFVWIGAQNRTFCLGFDFF